MPLGVGLHIGRSGSFGPTGDYVRISLPSDGADAIGLTPWAVSASEPAEVRINTGTWHQAHSGVMNDIPGFSGLGNVGFTLNARLIGNTGVTSSISLTKVADNLTYVAPTPGALVDPVDMADATATLPIEARMVVGALSSEWRAHTAPVTLDALSRPAGGGSSIFPSQGNVEIGIAFRLRDHTYRVVAETVYSAAAPVIMAPPANALVLSTDTLIFSNQGDADRAEARIQGEINWTTGAGNGALFTTLQGFNNRAYEESFFVDVRYKSAQSLIASQIYRRGALLTITAPTPNAIVGGSAQIDLDHDGFSPEVRIANGAWVPWVFGLRMDALPEWGGIVENQTFTLEARLADALAFPVQTRSLRRQAAADTAFSEAGAGQKPRPAALTVSITSPSDGTIDIDNDDTFTVTCSNAALDASIQVSVNGTQWTTLASGTFAQIAGFAGLPGDQGFTLQARLQSNIYTTDSVSLTKGAAVPTGGDANVIAFLTEQGAGTQVIPHGCSTTPTHVEFLCSEASGFGVSNGDAWMGLSIGQDAGSTRINTGAFTFAGNPPFGGFWYHNDASALYYYDGNLRYAGRVTGIDATNITITWDTSPTGAFAVLLACYAVAGSHCALGNSSLSQDTITHGLGAAPTFYRATSHSPWQALITQNQWTSGANGDCSMSTGQSANAANQGNLGFSWRNSFSGYNRSWNETANALARGWRGNETNQGTRFVEQVTATTFVMRGGTEALRNYSVSSFRANNAANGQVQAPASPGRQSVSAGFRPEMVQLLSNNDPGSGGVYFDGNSVSIAYCADAGNAQGGAVTWWNSAGSASGTVLLDSGNVLRVVNGDGSLMAEGSIEITANGFDIVWSTVNGRPFVLWSAHN